MAGTEITLSEINAMSDADFVATFGDVAEHAPWVAETAASARPFDGREEMIGAFHEAVKSAAEEKQLALIRAHPDLAGKAALAGKLTEDSKSEQAGAGLDSLSVDELAEFTRLNDAYLERFEFPFIFAVKGATKYQILDSFRERIGKEPADEFAMALKQVCRIIRFRLEDKVSG